jgi:hypothetical protein
VGSLLLTWPLAAHFTTHVPGDGIDDPALAWNLWWAKFQLVDRLQLDLFHVGWMFHPIDINLAFYTLTPLNGLLSIPLQTSLGLVVANNLILLSSFVLGGYGTFLLVQSVWSTHFAQVSPPRRTTIAWLAGAFYAFASAKLFYAGLGQFNIASSQWLPFALLYFWRSLQPGSLRRAVRSGLLAGLFLTLQAWAELTYASFLLVFVGLVYLWFWVAWLLNRAQTRQALLTGTAAMVAAGLVFLVGIAPFLAAMLPDMRQEGDFFASGGGFADTFSADLLGYLLPTRLHPWLGEFTAARPFPNDKGQHIYLGYALMALAAIGAVAALRRQGSTRKIGAFWLVALIGFGWLTLGPEIRWAGESTGISGPFALISQLPFFSGNRYPSRYSVMLLAAAAVLAAYGLLVLTRRRVPRTSTWVLAAAALFFSLEHLSVPLPINDFRVPPLYARLAAEPGDFAVLELPTGWRNGARVLGRADVLIMMQQWYQTAHTKRRLGGNTSRNPAYKFQYFSETPLLAEWIALMNADRDHLAPEVARALPHWLEHARTQAPLLLDWLGIRYVILYEAQATPALTTLVEEALPLTLVETWQGEDWRGESATLRLYAVTGTPPATVAFDMAAPDAQMLLAEGWSPSGDEARGRFALRRQVDLILPALTAGGRITLTYASPVDVHYRLEGADLGLGHGAVHTLAVPPDSARQPAARLTLELSSAPRAPAALVPNPVPIGSTGATLPAGSALMVRSAGEEVGNLAEIWLNGENLAAGRRGYNLAAISPTGEVLGTARFDTFAAGESSRMAVWLDNWPGGTIVAGAVADEASLSLEQTGVDALARLGAAQDLRSGFRASHAFVGVVGAAPGSALEARALVYPATVWIGAPLAAPAAYAALRTVVVTRSVPR